MKLFGIPLSNYYNIVKLALLEKQIDFDEVHAPPSQEKEFIIHSPMGKIPYLQHGDLFICESQAILFYLELFKPSPRLYPLDPERGAKAQQVHQFIDLYIDAEARTLLPAAFFGAQASDEQIEQVSNRLKQRVQALSQITEFAPFIAGKQLSHA
ncbi:MAG: glutathione S-transferase family protein, partial [Halopseudomonas sp.]